MFPKKFDSIEAFNKYMESEPYGSLPDNPPICFAFSLIQKEEKSDEINFDYTLHYFDLNLPNSIQDIPKIYKNSLDPFQNGPDMNSYSKWLKSGYLEMMKLINDEILHVVTKSENGKIDLAIMAQKYSPYSVDEFGLFIGLLLPLFILIAYLSPLCVLVFRMVQDKESKAKEGMKIMGLKEYIYFLSYFLNYLILVTIYSIINSLIISTVLKHIGFIYIFAMFWLYGMSIFGLGFFFQAMMDKKRIAIIISILIYFVMFFVSAAIQSDDVTNTIKMIMSLLPPTALSLGIKVITKYEINFINFTNKNVYTQFENYSVGSMYLMLFVDFVLYMFVGFYAQNVISHDTGLKRPYYFLCTKNYWCRAKKYNNRRSTTVADARASLILEKNENFEEEYKYESKLNSGECLQIRSLKKVFDDGKVAVNGLNLNLYNQEIFALLGHNGAGKSTTISILCGLYEATAGKAMYNDMNILEDDNMDEFRKNLGICPQHDVLFDSLTVKEHLAMFCIFKGVQADKRDEEIEKTLEDIRLKDKENTIAKNLSGGQRRKLSVSIALIGGSQVVFLDEPSSGMDITSRRELWDILKKCTGNRIIVLTTHYMEEAAVLGERIGIVSNGKLKCSGSSLFLIDKFGKYISVNVIKQNNANDNDIINFIKDRIPNVEYEILTEEILFKIPKPKESELKDFSLKRFFKDLDANLDILRVKTYGASMPTLEDVFLNVSADSTHKSKLINNF